MLEAASTQRAWRAMRTIARRALVLLGIVASVVAVAGAALVLYLESAPGRRWLAARVNGWVSGALVSELKIERIEVLSVDRLVISRATLLDAGGRPILQVRSLEARFALLPLLESALFGHVLDIEITDVRAEELAVGLFQAPDGALTLTHAFDLRVKKPTGTAGRPTRVHLPHVRIVAASARTDRAGFEHAGAELRGLEGSIDIAPEAITLTLLTKDSRVTRALPAEVHGHVDARVRLPGSSVVTLDGSLGAVPVKASFNASPEGLGLRVSSPSLTPDAMRELVPGWPLAAPLGVSATLDGSLEKLRAHANVESGSSQLEGAGSLAVTPALGAELALAAHALDLRLFGPDLPETALELEAKLLFRLDGGPRLEATGHLAASKILGVARPRAHFQAVYAGDHLTGNVTADDPALPLAVDFDVAPTGALNFEARARQLSFAALAPYGVSATGSADADATGTLEKGVLRANFEAALRGVRAGELRAESTRCRGSVRGSLGRPRDLEVELHAVGAELHVGPEGFSAWQLDAQGSPRRAAVALRGQSDTRPTLEATATLGFAGGLSFTDAHAEAELGGTKTKLDVKSGRFAQDFAELSDATLTVGDGTLVGSAVLAPRHEHIELRAQRFDPGPLFLAFAGTDRVHGRIDAELVLDEDAHARNGRLDADVKDAVVPGLGSLEMELGATLAGSTLDGEGSFDWAELGRGKVSGKATVAPGALDLPTLRAALGEVEVELSDIDLRAVSERWLPTSGVSLDGRADVLVHLARKEFGRAEAGYALQTHDLKLAFARTDDDGSAWNVDLRSQGELGEDALRASLLLRDANGPWLSASVEQTLGFRALLEHSWSAAASTLLHAPVRAALVALPRPLELLGSAGSDALHGNFSANVGITGTPLRPELNAAVRVGGLGVSTVDAKSGLEAVLAYSAQREEYAFDAHSAGSARANLALRGHGHFGWLERGLGSNWSTEADGHIDGLDLKSVGQLVGAPLAGRADGDMTLKASAKTFEASGDLALRELAFEEHALGDGNARLRVHDGRADARLDVGGSEAKLGLSTEFGLSLGAGGPTLDPTQGGKVRASVQNYRLETFAPFVQSVASDIEGPLNGFIALTWGPADAAGQHKTKLTANASVSGARLTLAGGGGSVRNVELRALADGGSVLRVAFSGSARSERPNLSGKADITWDGFAPRRIDADLRVQNFPLSYQGILYGTATIDQKERPLHLGLELGAKEPRLEIELPTIEITLPNTEDTQLVELTPDPAVTVVDAKTAPKPAHDAGSSSLGLSLRLGAGVRLKRSGLLVPVSGSLSRGADGRLDGTLVVSEGGVVPALGQVFRLKRGTVSFKQQDIKDGALALEASTRVADGTVIDLSIGGTVEKPVLSFRSDPPRTENEIVALLLGVQPDDNSAGQSQDLGSSAAAFALNRLLSGSPLASLQFGAGQSRTGEAINTVSVRAGNTVWLEGRTVRASQTMMGEETKTSGVVDWRFARGFSLRTQLGNVSGVEMRWSHRY
jgi:TamB, inner membrane protein subunit of TAM complex